MAGLVAQTLRGMSTEPLYCYRYSGISCSVIRIASHRKREVESAQIRNGKISLRNGNTLRGNVKDLYPHADTDMCNVTGSNRKGKLLHFFSCIPYVRYIRKGTEGTQCDSLHKWKASS